VRGAGLVLVAAGCASGSCGERAAAPPEAEARPLNVLLLCVDDLRPELGCYGAPGARTPNVDALAARGLRFDRAYCSIASCGPSRVALLTGLRPETSGARKQWSDYRELVPEVVALPELFLRAGWETAALGKIHHGGGELDDERSWSAPPWRPSRWQRYYALPESRAAVAAAEAEWERQDAEPRVLAWEAPDVPDGELPDGMIADEAIRFLRRERERPFFLAVGFLKPHLPFVAPQRFWELHPPESVDLSRAPELPTGAPAYASNESIELLAFRSIEERGLGEETRRTLVRGYRACVSFVDAQVGRVLEALEAEGLAESTVVILWGDHGFHLGDQGMWGKHTNYEQAARTPLVLSVPGQESGGGATGALVESVDLYPTLAELCGLEAPAEVEGVSLVPLLDDPDRAWKTAVFGEYQRRHPADGRVRGRSIRTSRYRLVEWRLERTDERVHELYDLSADQQERQNLAPEPGREALVEDLSARLARGWRGALPPSAPRLQPESAGARD